MDTLASFARELMGLELTPEQLRSFQTYAVDLIEWNRRVNLTAITDPHGIEIKHFLDSLTALLAIRPDAGIRVVDVGTGAGFPGIPLKIVCPGIELVLLESVGKKVRFLEHIVRKLGLTGVDVVRARAEEMGRDPQYREQFDLVIARAVAWMPVLVEYLLPLCKIGGHCLAYKGENAHAEVLEAEGALRVLGGRVVKVIPVELPGVTETRHLVLVAKEARSPGKYPRRPGIPSKRPILAGG